MKNKIEEMLKGCEHDGSYVPVSEVKRLMKEYADHLFSEKMPSDEEIKEMMTTKHYHYEKGHYRKVRLDRIQGGKMVRNLIKQRYEREI